MGQSIVIAGHTVSGNVVMFDTDRSITGQDGQSYSTAEEAGHSDIFPARLAERLFQSDTGIDHVFVASNQIVVRRRKAWDDDQLAGASQVITDLFRFYPD